MVNFEFKNNYSIADLIEIVHLLRGPGGCPWDMEQDHRSIRKNLIEETYEVAEAIDNGDSTLLREELGDLLLQVALHAQMEEEAGCFSFDDVCNDICKKLIIRHPHVFGDTAVSGAADVLKNWETIKERTKGQTTAAQTLDSVPRTLPALMRAAKVQHRAAKTGFEYQDLTWALGDLMSEVGELEEALESKDQTAQKDELGDVLFAAVNVARFLGMDAEEALTDSTDKFLRRFAIVEKLAQARGISLKDCPTDIMDALWDEAKKDVG